MKLYTYENGDKCKVFVDDKQLQYVKECFASENFGEEVEGWAIIYEMGDDGNCKIENDNLVTKKIEGKIKILSLE